MNKNIIAFSLIIFLSFSFRSHAQIHAGPKAGANLNHTKFHDLTTYHPGFNAGAFAQYDLLDFLSLNTEITYSQIGGGYDSGYYFVKPDIFRHNVNLTFHTVAVPLFVSLTWPSLARSAVKPIILLGAEYAYSFKTIESYDKVYRFKGEDIVSEDTSRDATKDFDVHQPAMLFGAGASMILFGRPAAIDVRYKSTFKKSDLPNGLSERLKMLSVNVGVTLFNF